ncbi:MAG: TonB family protein [Acidobacteria bacterium]|nr:TonB family protein [Acidobacteriota bacterium]
MNDSVPHLLVAMDEERIQARRRETFLLSVIVHLVGLLILATMPDLFQARIPVRQAEERQVTMLYEPPPQRPRLTAPPVPKPRPEAQSRLEQPLTRPIEPPPERLVVPRIPERRQGRDESAGKEQMARGLPPIGIPEFPEPPKEPPQQRPSLEPVPRTEQPPPNPRAQLTFPTLVPPSRGTQDILRGLARDRAAGGGSGTIADFPATDSEHPGLDMPGPQILSDTMGVDFHPYLLRIYLLVRRNWYSVIPEIARLGRQGRVALQFSIQRDGSVPDLTLVAGSGTSSMDNAALASIRLSNPFPSLPEEFPGDHIVLRFVYLYNLRISE